MKNAFHLAGKEIRSFSFSWVGVFLTVFFLILAGLFFSLLVLTYAKISMEAMRQDLARFQGLGLTRFVFSSFFLNLSFVLIFLIPVLSMRAFSEERRSRTLELLYTYPFSDFEIVLGKFLGLSAIFSFLVLPTAAYLYAVRKLGGELDAGPILAGYFGFWLLGNAYLALGLFVSSMTTNQVASAIASFAGLVFFWMLDWISEIADAGWASFFKAISPLDRYQEFTAGILDLANIAYFCFFVFFFLFLTLRSIETRNWRG